MKNNLRVLTSLLLFILSVGILFYLYERWQRIGKEVVVVMRSSNEDCDEFRCIWKIDRVIRGSLSSKEATSSCYLIRNKREYSSRDSVEWIEVEGTFTNEKGQDFYADCIGVLIFRDRAVKSIASNERPRR